MSDTVAQLERYRSDLRGVFVQLNEALRETRWLRVKNAALEARVATLERQRVEDILRRKV